MIASGAEEDRYVRAKITTSSGRCGSFPGEGGEESREALGMAMGVLLSLARRLTNKKYLYKGEVARNKESRTRKGRTSTNQELPAS